MSTVERTGTFQDPPELHDEWADDLALQRLLERILPAEVREEVTPSLAALGREAATSLRALSDAVDDTAHEPRPRPFDAWGNRVDGVEVSPLWEELGDAGKRHGVVATAYERAHGPHSRVHQMALAYLYAPSSGL